jgi:hypothetical protein
MILVDKTKNNNKSIFSIGDYRHNVPRKEEADFYSQHVSKEPKIFFGWDDGTKFNPKLKRDK